jgi:hypothetical protein
MFSPTTLSYTNISTDLSGQNYIANINCPVITDWKGEYWGNTSMTGAPVLCRNDTSINFPWGSGSPDPTISADNFSARWTRTMQFAPGLYRFSMSHDDGARLYIDDVIKIDATGTCCVWDQIDIPLSGSHTIRMEMFENSGGAGAQLDITTLSLYQPEIEVQGNNVVILDGDISASVTDHTNFGSVITSEGVLTRTFTIRNTGQLDLAFSGNPKVEISGANSSDFMVTSQPSSPIAPSGSTTFLVAFDPSASGVRIATISIANNDSNEDPYNFVIQGNGVASPEIDVRGNNMSISNGDIIPSSSDFTDFGNAEIAGNTVSRTFTIHNTGDSNLNLTGSPNEVAISGTNSSDFILSTRPLSPIAPGGSSTFMITFTPSATGIRKATLSISNSDANENPYTYSIQGNGVDNPAPAITSITRSSTSPTSLASVNFTVTFSEDVTGVDANGSDFSLTTTGVTGASITGVTPVSASVYTVAVNTGYRSGSIRLDVPNTATISDFVGNPLNGLPFSTGESYAITKPSPDLIITNVVLDPPNPTINETFNVIITINNQGGATGPATIYRDVYIGVDPLTLINPMTGCPSSGSYFRFDTFANLGPGQSDTKAVSITGGLPKGNYQLWVYVDSRCLVYEAGEVNNGQ